MVRFLSLLWLGAHFALLYASPDTWTSRLEAQASTQVVPWDNTFVIVRPIDPGNAHQVSTTHDALKANCGSDNVKSQQDDEGNVSWHVTLSETDSLRFMLDDPRLSVDEIARNTMAAFSKRHEKRTLGGLIIDPATTTDPYYIVYAKDSTKTTQTTATQALLESLRSNKDERISIIYDFDGSNILAWGGVQMNDDSRKQTEATIGVAAPLASDDPIEDDRALNGVQASSTTADSIQEKKSAHGAINGVLKTAVGRAVTLVRRALNWIKQENAGWDLVMISRPKTMKNDQLTDFIYPDVAGAGTWVYVIDAGVNVGVTNKDKKDEFPKRESLQTQASIDAKEDVTKDGTGHGTKVASKALGQKYGIAKQATVVSVKTVLKIHPERIGKSVVVAATGADNPDPRLTKAFKPALKRLFDNGIPYVASAGNKGEDLNINKNPQLAAADPKYPLIIVGAVDPSRKRTYYSQGGPLLTVYAPGGEGKGTDAINVPVQTRDDETEGFSAGTSYAAPLVGGLIATYLSYDNPPWDGTKTGKDRVAAIRDYVKSESSSWTDLGLQRTIWNGATKDNHQQAGEDLAPPAATSVLPAPTIAPVVVHERLAILAAQTIAPSLLVDFIFLTGTVGQGVGCSEDWVAPIEKVFMTDEPWNMPPGGTYDLNFQIQGQNCQYKNDGGDAGAIWCGDTAYSCGADTGGRYQCGTYNRWPRFTCTYS